MKAPPSMGRHAWHAALILTGFVMLLAGCGGSDNIRTDGYVADQKVKARAYNHRVRFLVIHYTGGDDRRALQVLTGPKVSTHYLIPSQPTSQAGKAVIRQMLPEHLRAWHAGLSNWGGRSNLNDSSIGIEIVNKGPLGNGQWQPYNKAQIKAVIALTRDLVKRYDIKPQNVLGHSDIAPGRKQDPGPAFPWYQLYKAGIGAWPSASAVAHYRQRFRQNKPGIKAVQAQLKRYGYHVSQSGWLDASTKRVLRAFQMHFLAKSVSGQPSIETLARLWALNDQYK